jgi:hypothetical protein
MVDEAQALVDEVEDNKGLEVDNDWEYAKNMEMWDDDLFFLCFKWELDPN